MNDFEKQLISSTKYKDNIKLWTRYVDDVLINWEGSIEEVHEFINEVNNKAKNLQFKEEIGGKKINYLDLNIEIKNNEKLQFGILKKESYSDIIIPRESYHPYRYKMAAINSFCYRAQKLSLIHI